MKFLIADSHFCSQAKFVPVAKACGRIDKTRSGIHLPDKPHTLLVTVGYNGIGMMRAVKVNMVNGFLEGFHDLHRQDKIEVFCSPVLL